TDADALPHLVTGLVQNLVGPARGRNSVSLRAFADAGRPAGATRARCGAAAGKKSPRAAGRWNARSVPRRVPATRGQVRAGGELVRCAMFRSCSGPKGARACPST